jgi:uncharacterized membrane protein
MKRETTRAWRHQGGRSSEVMLTLTTVFSALTRSKNPANVPIPGMPSKEKYRRTSRLIL